MTGSETEVKLNYKNVLTAGQLVYLKRWPAAGHLDTRIIMNIIVTRVNMSSEIKGINIFKLTLNVS